MFSPNLNTVLDRLMTASQAMDDAAVRSPPAVPKVASARSSGCRRWTSTKPDTAFVVEADLPGVHQENVDIQFDRNTLTVSGTRAATLPVRDKATRSCVCSAPSD